jgi:hypothetical protein
VIAHDVGDRDARGGDLGLRVDFVDEDAVGEEIEAHYTVLSSVATSASSWKQPYLGPSQTNDVSDCATAIER